MSEIPFVNRLGEAIEMAIARSPQRPRRWRPSRLVVVLAALLTIGSGAALAAILSSPTELATNGVACYETDINGDMTGIWAGERTPEQACREALSDQGRPLPASLATCDSGRGAIAVFPGSGPDACKQAGLKPLPAGYSAEQARVAALASAIGDIETSADCIEPRRFAERVQGLLAQSGWTGWRVSLRLDGSFNGPCGSASGLGGDGRRTIAGTLDASKRRVFVFGAPHRSTADFLSSEHGIAGPLMDASGERCYDQAGIHELTRRWLVKSRRSVAFTVSPPPPPSRGELMGERGRRLTAGCAVITEVKPAADGINLVVQIWQRD